MIRAVAVAVALCALTDGRATACARPTDPQGFGGYAFGADVAQHFDGQALRIWYTVTGPHAVDATSSRMDQVPDNVVTAATVGDAALASYAQMGFRAPISDGTCGGDGRLDIYLMHFAAADGDAASESCVTVSSGAMQCAAFGLVEAHLEQLYGSFDLGAHVVVNHELFHAVQDAYDAGLDRFWAEGTAQWAAKTLDPSEMDFEANLPAFFADAGRSIDVPPGGVTNGYFYGAALWPLFLTLNAGPDEVRHALEEEALLGPPSMDAIGAALVSDGKTLAEEYGTFAAWNAATGQRAGVGGYSDSSSYPQVKTLTPLGASGVSDVGSGYSVFFYQFDFGAATQQLTVDADATRLIAKTFPLPDAHARLDELTTLPATITGPGVLVVAGISGKKSDAPFTIHVGAPSVMMDAGSTPPATMMPSGGCSLTMNGNSRDTWLAFLFLIALALWGRFRGIVAA